MRGYFSKLAKQSGLRNGQVGANLPSRMSVEKSSENAPLHREETIFTAQDTETKSPENARNFALAVEKTINEKNFNSNQINELKTPETRLSASSDEWILQTEMPAIENSNDKTFSVNEKTEVNNLLTIEKVIFKEADKSMTAEAAENSASPTETVKSEVVEAEPILPAYFQKTSELIKSGTASPLEIQQILLREVQEWVRDSPTTENIGKAENIIEKREEVRAIVAPIEKKSIVLQESLQAVAENAEKLQEQNFSLSIGNISITVEEPENKVQTEIVSQNRTTAANQTNKRQYSRLSRYYL